MKTKNVLVTGGAGYIGSHACKALMQAGYVPVTVDNLITGWSEAVRFGPFEQVDLLDDMALRDVFKKYKPGAVMHFAAHSQVSESVVDPQKYWRNNLQGSLNLIEAAMAHNCKNIIFSSTCATYGNHDHVVLTETTSQLPTNSYGSSKRAVEELIQQYSNAYGINYVIFRYFNVAGADPDAEIGEFHVPETHLIPKILESILDGLEPITIFGLDYPTDDGSCVRDYVHVCDLVDAHLLGLTWLETQGANRVYNLGTGQGFSVLEIIKHAAVVTGQQVKFVEGPRREGDCTKLVSGSELAEKELGWTPKRSNLSALIEDAWRWQKKGGYKS